MNKITHIGLHEVVLANKLALPYTDGENVIRSRLFEKFQSDTIRPLNIICAAAGFGKTTLLTSWLAQQKRPCAWLSLDEQDNDPARFLLCLIATIRKIDEQFGSTEEKVLLSPMPPKIISLLPSLLNRLHLLPQRFILAFDDYHTISDPEIHEVINYMVDHLPAGMRIFITTRTEPPLALAKLRVRRQLCEISESDLRFNSNESAKFLNEISDLNLTTDELRILASRTEGWVAGLQLAALSLTGEVDRQAFVRAFAGDDRYITDYLTQEVLQRQPEQIKQFLLHTSILDRLCGPLCEALTNIKDCNILLETLENSNMFIIPLDRKRHWYRYHHLFADLLRHQLQQTNADLLPQLHLQASEWYAQNGDIHDAMRHALAAENFEYAAKLIELHGMSLFEKGQVPTLMRWFEKIPSRFIQDHPVRIILFAWNCFISGREIPENMLHELEQDMANNRFSHLDNNTICAIKGDLVFFRGFQAMYQCQYQSAITIVEQAMVFYRQAKAKNLIAPQFHLACAYYASGEVDEAIQRYGAIIEAAFNTQYLIVLNGIICGLGRALTKKGELDKALQHFEFWLARLKKENLLDVVSDILWLYVAMARIAYEQNELEKSERYLLESAEFAKRSTWESSKCVIDIRLARVYFAQNKPQAVNLCLERISKYQITPSLVPLFPDAHTDLIRLKMQLGRLDEVELWLQQQKIVTGGEIDPVLEYEYIVWIRYLVACHQLDKAITLISKVQIGAERAGRIGVIIELLVLQALARQAQGNNKRAVESLNRAIELGSASGFVRTFLNEGTAMVALLERLVQSELSGKDYARQLLTYCENADKLSNNSLAAKSIGPVEPLSAKELKTLSLLVTGLSNKEIAEQLYVSTNTVKTHIKHIYAKLGVNNRAQVINKSKKLNLL